MVKVQLVKVSGHVRLTGEDAEGNTYSQQFNSDTEDSISNSMQDLEYCPACGKDVSQQEDLEFCDHCGEDMFDALRPECDECGALVYAGWLCMDGGELLCDDCVILPDESEVGPDERAHLTETAHYNAMTDE